MRIETDYSTAGGPGRAGTSVPCGNGLTHKGQSGNNDLVEPASGYVRGSRNRLRAVSAFVMRTHRLPHPIPYQGERQRRRRSGADGRHPDQQGQAGRADGQGGPQAAPLSGYDEARPRQT